MCGSSALPSPWGALELRPQTELFRVVNKPPWSGVSYPPPRWGDALQVKVVSTGTTGLAIQLKCSNRPCLWTQPSVRATIWKTEKLTTEGELDDQDAPSLVPEEAFSFVTSLETQEKPRGEVGWEKNTGEKRDFFLRSHKVDGVKIPQASDISSLTVFITQRDVFHCFSNLRKGRDLSVLNSSSWNKSTLHVGGTDSVSFDEK